MSKQIVFGIVGVLGLVCIIGGSVFLGLFPGIIDKKIREELPLKKGSDSYDRWQKVQVPIHMKFHIFNVTNPDVHELKNISIVETGPLVYTEMREKENINYTDKDSLVSYEERRVYTLDEKQSTNLKESDKVTFVNIPVLGIAFNYMNTLAPLMYGSNLDKIPADEKVMFATKTAGDLLFKGYHLKIFEMIESLGVKGLNPFSISDGGKNKSERPWQIHTGIQSMDKFGQIIKFDGESSLMNTEEGFGGKSRIWKYDVNNTSCNKLEGTDATMFSPSISKNDILYVFEPQLCRTVYFKYEKETSVRDIDTYRFWVPDEYFESAAKNRDNRCYCLETDDSLVDKLCKINGILDISNCALMGKGAPVVMSAPYFLHGDKELRDKINLRNPKELINENYGTFLDIEPLTGIVLRAAKRIQVNIKVKHSDLFPQLKLLNATDESDQYLLPVVWIEESAEADEAAANDFKSMVTNPKKLGVGIAIAVIVVGALMTITAVVLYVRLRRRLNNTGMK